MNIQQELNNLPYYITRENERKCPCCEKTIIKERIQYELKLDIVPNCDNHRYRLYYKSNNYGQLHSFKYIGENAGIGFNTIEEAIEDLKRHLRLL